MAIKEMTIHLDGKQQQLQNWQLEPIAGAPAAPFTGQMWRNTTSGRINYYDGTAAREVVHLADLESFSAWNGTHDASTGIPTVGSGDGAAIRGGDRWLVGTAGTITGIGGGSNDLGVGDVIIANADGAATAGDFTVIQANVDLSGAVVAETYTLASIPANTATPIGTGLANVHSIVTLTNAGAEIGMDPNYNAKTVEANIALTNIDVRVLGTL